MAPASETRSFRASERRLYAAALKAVSILGYSIQHTDGAAGVISFNTGFSMRSWAGQDMTVTVIAGMDGMNEVAVGGRRAQRSTFGEPQVFDWGERGKVTRQFFEAFYEHQFEVHTIHENTSKPVKITRCKVCGGTPEKNLGNDIHIVKTLPMHCPGERMTEEQILGIGDTIQERRMGFPKAMNRHFRDYPVTGHAADMPKSTRMTLAA